MNYKEKQSMKAGILRSIDYCKRYIEDCEKGLIDDIEGCYEKKEQIVKYELELESLSFI